METPTGPKLATVVHSVGITTQADRKLNSKDFMIPFMLDPIIFTVPKQGSIAHAGNWAISLTDSGMHRISQACPETAPGHIGFTDKL